MKNWNQDLTLLKRITLFYSLIQLTLTLNSQTGPGIQWYREQWLNEDIVAQDDSGEDWYYDFKPYIEDAIMDGYVGAGFSSIMNETLPGANCANCGESDVIPYFWETSTHQLGCYHPKIVEIDLKGEVEWYNLYGPENSSGYFRSVVQTDNGYVAIGGLSFEGDDELIYNYQVGLTGSELAGCPEIEEVESKYSLLYLVETDKEGNLVAERTYGWGSPSDAAKFSSEGLEIILDTDGSGYAIAGITSVNIEREDGPDGYLSRAWIIKIDEDLEIEWERTYELTIPSPLDNVPWSLATCIIESGDYYFVGCTQDPEHDFDESFIHILQIRRLDGLAYDPGDVVKDFTINTDVDADILTPLSGEDLSHNRPFQLIFNDNDLLVAAGTRRNKYWGSTEVRGIAKVYRIDVNAVPDWTVDVIEITESKTFDLKTGITNTSDGGYAVTTTIHAGDLIDELEHPYNKEYYPSEFYAFEYDDHSKKVNTSYWNADAYIAKFDDVDNLEWDRTFPLLTSVYNEDVMFPNDIKRMECVYHIVQTPDDGFIVAGNSSSNFDDDLVIKVYPDCAFYTAYTGENDIASGSTISTNTTWSSSKKVRGIITITSGHSLTISGSSTVIEFADSKAADYPTYIIVERGAKLQIDGGAILTGNAACGTMWDGIMVYGTNGDNQPSVSSIISHSYFDNGGDHGVVRIITGGTIKNARYGVFAGKRVGNLINSSYGGGIVIAEGANFINNSIDVYFTGFNKSNRSLLRNCNFSTDAILLDQVENPIAHVFLGATKNINIRGCNFENSTTTDEYPDDSRGKGIFSNNSYFTVNDSPDGFGTGGTGTNPNTFTDLTYGIYAIATEVGANIIEVNKNIFDNNVNGFYLSGSTLSETNQNTFTIKPANSSYGLYLDGCTAYDVQENIFTKDEADLYVTIGMIINNSGTGNNFVYKNVFSNLKEGSIALKNNGSTSPAQGLIFKCGDYSTSWIDIGVVTQGGTTGSLHPQQGECLGTGVGGYLTAPANNLFTDPDNVTSNGQYFASSGVSSILYTFFEDVDASTSPYAQPEEYSSAIDPYPTGGLNTGCATVTFDIEDWDTEYCPTGFGSSGGGGERTSNPGYRDMILQNRKDQNEIFIREGNDTLGILENTWLDDIMLHAQLRYYIKNDMTDSITYILEGDESPLAKSLLSAIAAESGDYSGAETIISGLENELTDAQGYSAELQTIGLQLLQDTLTWLEVDSVQFADIVTLSEIDSRIGIQAQHIMHQINGTTYHEIIPIIDEEQEEIAKVIQKMETSELNTIDIYPNPVSKYGVIQINLDNENNNSKLIIANLTGEVLKEYDLKNGKNYIEINNTILHQGVYIGYITNLNFGKLNKQFIVIQ